MTSDEQQALTRAHQPWNRALWAMSITIPLVFLTAALVALQNPGTFQHFLGQSSKQTATVTNIDEASFCTRSNQDQYTVTWSEEGIHHSEVISNCGNSWQVGDELTIWSTGGIPQAEGPLALQISVGVLLLGLTVATIVLIRHRSRVRRAAARALNGTWQPESYRTKGVAGSPDFQIYTPAPIHSRRRHWTRKIFMSKVRTAPPAEIPGTLYVDKLQGARPRGLSLHELDDGTRFWRWHGG